MNGILIINKPKGYTSHDVVNVLRKELNTKKIGHTGTLDPNATGVLPILIGHATKISKYLIEHDKTYIAELKLGEKSSTGDIEGEIIEKKEIPDLTIEQVETVLKSFLGKQLQTPPIYSSIKINGKKAYEYARKGEQVEIPPREIEIMNISLIKFENDIITLEVSCSKGTYIRVLCEDIAEKLGTVGLMNNLTRTIVDKFDIKDAYTLEDIKNKQEISLLSIEEIFNTNPSINLNDKKTELFLNGVKLSVELKDDIYRIYNNNIFLGLGIVKDKLLKRDIIIIDDKKCIDKVKQIEEEKNGCYDVCTNCLTGGNCCSSFDRINAPVINKKELIQLKEALKSNDFYDVVADNLYKIRLNNNECIFLKNGRCSIYDYRPLDCKLYPFDIIKKDSKHYLVLYQLGCIEEYTVVENFDCLDDLIEKIKPWIIDYTDDRNYTKMKSLKYKVIKEIKG